MARYQYDYLCVLDFEATCDNQGNFYPQEIIEFPVVVVRLEKGFSFFFFFSFSFFLFLFLFFFFFFSFSFFFFFLFLFFFLSLNFPLKILPKKLKKERMV